MGWDGPMTHRQFLAWQEFLEEEWFVPTGTDGYLMKLLTEVTRMFAKDPNKIQPKDFLHKKQKEGEQGGMTLEQATAYSKAKYAGIETALQHNQEANKK